MANKPILGVLSHVDPEIFMDMFDLRYISRTSHLYDNNRRVDAILFGVGTDINPAIYGEYPNSHTQQPDTQRDKFEKTIFGEACSGNIPLIGICRGAQLICALMGGKLVQHVTGHAGSRHNIKTEDGRVINVNSYHHQMMIPMLGSGYKSKVLACTEIPRSTVYLGEDNADIRENYPDVVKEVEVVAYGRGDYDLPNMIAIQGHPEWEPEGSEFRNYTLELTERFILGKERV